MKNIEDLQRDAQSRCREAEQRQRVQQRRERKAQEILAQRQNFAIGELVARYFPELRKITPGTKAETAERYSKLEECLRRLAANPELISTLSATPNDSPSVSNV